MTADNTRSVDHAQCAESVVPPTFECWRGHFTYQCCYRYEDGTWAVPQCFCGETLRPVLIDGSVSGGPEQ